MGIKIEIEVVESFLGENFEDVVGNIWYENTSVRYLLNRQTEADEFCKKVNQLLALK